MKPVKTVCYYNDQAGFENECECLINEGYILDSSSSGFLGNSDVCFNATFVIPVSDIKVVPPSASDNKHIKQFPKSTEIWNHVTSFLSWNPGYDSKHAREIALLVSKYISQKLLNA